MSRSPLQEAENFIANETQFHLGYLVTEQSHPKTRGLSELLEKETRAGVKMLLEVDDDLPPVLEKVLASAPYQKLVADMEQVLSSSGRIHFSGCGATGRLSILIDSAYRHFWEKAAARNPELTALKDEFINKTNAVMTGGDFALIRSVESFEDFISFGYNQIKEAGLQAGDMTVAISEGGETSSVIGTIHAALDTGVPVSFLFNNPAELLVEHVERSRRVITDSRVNVLDLTTGPMSVAGSTRMQATTMELLAAGSALETALAHVLQKRLDSATLQTLGLDLSKTDQTPVRLKSLLNQLRTPENLDALAAYVDFEADLYAQRGKVTYFADKYLLDIFTDTTERAPTFKTPPFHSKDDKTAPDPWAFVKDPCRSTKETWLHVLAHEPRCLDWTPDTYRAMQATESIIANPPKISRDLLYTFQIGREEDPTRTNVSPNAAVAFLMGNELNDLVSSAEWNQNWQTGSAPFEQRAILFIGPKLPESENFGEKIFGIKTDLPETPLDLWGHLAAKLVLNNISTAALGKIGRLSSNWMAHVEASNKKLLDRSTRLIAELANVDYRTACVMLFETIQEMTAWPLEKSKTISPAAYSVEKLKNRR